METNTNQMQSIQPNHQALSILNSMPEELLNQYMLQRFNGKLETVIANINELKEVQSSLRNDLKAVEQQNKAELEKISRIQERKYSDTYVNRTTLGAQFDPIISRHRMTKLLIYAGILIYQGGKAAIKHTKAAKEPVVINGKYVDNNGGEHPELRFHAQKAWDLINEKLISDGIYNKFYSIGKPVEMEKYIDGLLEK